MTGDQRPDRRRAAGADQGAGRARLRIYIGAAPGVGKTYEMLQEAHALRRQRARRGGRLRRDLRPPRHPGAAQGSRGHSRGGRSSTAARRWRRWTSTRSCARKPAGVRRRRAGAHQRAGQPARQALRGRARAARRRHSRDDRGEHPAPRDAQRRGRQGDRRARARDGARIRSSTAPTK